MRQIFRLCLDLHHEQFAEKARARLQNEDAPHDFQLFGLAEDLCQALLRSFEDHGDAGDRRVGRFGYSQRVDVESPPAVQADDTRQNVRLVINVDADYFSFRLCHAAPPNR